MAAIVDSTTANNGYDRAKEVGNSIIANDDHSSNGENASLRFHCILSSGQQSPFYVTKPGTRHEWRDDQIFCP